MMLSFAYHECTGGCPRCCAASKHLEKRAAEKEREWKECQRAWESERDSQLLEAQERAQQASVQAVQEAQKRWREEAAQEAERVRQEAEAKLQQQRAEAEAGWRQEFLEQQRAQEERHKVLEEQRRAREEEGIAQERARWQREAEEWKQRMEAAERARLDLEQQAREREEEQRRQETVNKEEESQQQQQPRFLMVPDGNAFEERLRECLEQALESLWCSDSGLAQHRARVTVVRPNAKRCGDVQVCVDGQPVALVEAKEGKTRVSHAHGLWKLNRDSLAKRVPCRILVTAQAPLCLGNRQDVLKDPCVQTHPDGTLLVVMLDKCPSQQQADAAVRSMLLHVSRAVFSALEEDGKDGVPAAATQLTCRNQVLNALAPQLESIKALRTLYASLGGAEEDFETQMRAGLTSGCRKTLAEPASGRKRPRKPATVLPT